MRVEDIKQCRNCIGLLSSMVKCGEQHDLKTERAVTEAIKILLKAEIKINAK